MGCCSFRGAPCFCFAFNLPTHGSRLRFSNISPGHRSTSNPRSQADRCSMVTSNSSSTPVQSMESILPSRSSSSTQPVSMLKWQALSSHFIFVSFPPYGTLTVVCRAFFVIRSRTFFDGSKGFVLFSKEYKKSEPFSYRKKVRILLLWCTSRDSNPGPTD